MGVGGWGSHLVTSSLVSGGARKQRAFFDGSQHAPLPQVLAPSVLGLGPLGQE